MQEARLATPRPRRPTTMAPIRFGSRRLDDHFGGIAPPRLRLDGRDPGLSRSFLGLLENAIRDGVERGAEIFFSTRQTPQFLARETSQADALIESELAPRQQHPRDHRQPEGHES